MAIKTHYENLKVARDAPSDVIRAAYKALTQKYSSTRNPTAETQKLLEIINASNSVLSNPVKRAEYDQWLFENDPINSEQKNSDKKNKSKHKTINHVFNDDEEIIIGKESDVIAFVERNNAKLWPIYTGIVFVILIALAWFGLTYNGIDTADNQAQQIEQTEENLNQTASAQDVLTQDNNADTKFTPEITAIDIPAHDKVSIGKFVGLWQEKNNISPVPKTLDITKKSDNSIVFRLNTKAGQSIGGVYGIADFTKNYALFFNEEYGCSILFTMKSNAIQITTSSCQEYNNKGDTFDGFYIKPIAKKIALATTHAIVTEKVETESLVEPVTVQPVVIKKQPMLYKYLATVKDAEGNVSEIELIAKDKDAARIIIRDFRGNPKVLKLKQLKK